MTISSTNNRVIFYMFFTEKLYSQFSNLIFQHVWCGYDGPNYRYWNDNTDDTNEIRFHHEDLVEVETQISNVAYKDGSQQHSEQFVM